MPPATPWRWRCAYSCHKQYGRRTQAGGGATGDRLATMRASNHRHFRRRAAREVARAPGPERPRGG